MLITLKLGRRTPPQKKISQSSTRFNYAVWGRQSGKSTFGVSRIISKPLQGREEGIYWFILQTHTATEVMFRRALKALSSAPDLMATKPNQTHKRITLANGANIFFKSGEVLQNLRNETLDGVIIDEMRLQQKELWSEIVRPMLARRKGWADVYTTPNGFDHSYDLFEQAKLDPEWSTFRAPSTEAFWWTKEEIDSARRAMSELEFQQEIMAEFVDLTQGKAYLTHGEHNQVILNPFTDGTQYSPYLPIIVGMDFNVSPIAWTLGQQKFLHWHWIEEINMRNSHTQEAAKELVDRVKGHKPGVIIVGDASGHARKTSAAGATDYSIVMEELTKAGIKVMNQTPESNPSVKDRVNLVNSKLKSADGTVYLTYNPLRCPSLKKDFERVSWKLGANAILDQHKDPTLTHQSDSIGYPMFALSEGWKPKVGKMSIIARQF